MIFKFCFLIYILQRYAVCSPFQMFSGCDKWLNSMNSSDPSLNCHRHYDEWRFESQNIVVNIISDKQLDIECRQPEENMQNELKFFDFPKRKYSVLTLNNCTKLRDFNTQLDHLVVSNIENFNLKYFTVLQELELKNASQFKNLNNLEQLETLTIQEMYLSNLTIKLDRLAKLSLISNYIADDLNGIELPNLTTLYLHTNRNLQLADFENFPNLVKLEISAEFENETYDINRVKLNSKLKLLDISYFKLNDISNEKIFAGQKNLQILRLNDNGISKIKHNIFKDLLNLEELDLSTNELENINFMSGVELRRLRVLNVARNQITALHPGTIHTLTALEILYLNSNNIKHIANDFFTTAHKNLHSVYLQQNQLSFLLNPKNNPFELIAPSLVTLNLQSNNIKEFNEMYVSEFHCLANLDLSHNKIRMIRGSELEFRHPINVSFESNEIEVIRIRATANFSKVALKFGGNDRFDRKNCINYEFIKYFTANRAGISFPALDDINIKHYYCFEANDNSMCAQCMCKKFPYTKNYYIHCRNRNLTKLPEELPSFPDPSFAVSLDLDNNNFTALSKFELPAIYYTKIQRLSLRNCSINNFVAFNALENRISELYLDDNHIANFSFDVVNNFAHLTNLTLANNRFECNCDTEYFYKFYQRQNYSREDLLKCRNFNNTNFFANKQFIECRIMSSALITTLVVTLALVIILATTTIIKLKFALELKLLLFVFKNRHSNMVTPNKYRYDLFLSYSDDDTVFVEKNILSKLETDTKKPCNQIVTINRDSKFDKMIPDQIVDFVDNSKFVVIVLSTNFLNSEWNRFVFRTAYCNAFQNDRYPVIIILKDEIKDLKTIDPTLKSYLTTRTYLKYDSPFFWKRIRYILSK